MGTKASQTLPSRSRRRAAVDKDEAVDQARCKAIELHAIHAALIAAPETEPEIAPKTEIGTAIDDYLRFVRAHRKQRTYTTNGFTLDTLLRGRS